ncbi:hypothetical protein KAU40_02195 [Candidatus Parcubacteria bacterium]|nr:hypothetical protein [Candidatus Parcubacteria bacterium]
MTIGIPRALIYWKRPDFWQSFFENLGCDVLLSPKTNKEIIEKGVKSADPETCFSFKVFFGHLLWLDEKCDFVFVPCLKTNKEKLEYCPKFFGLPDLAKILTKTPILTETFDERKEKFEKTLKKLGKKLNKSRTEIQEAIKIALLKEKETKEKQKKDFFEKIKSKKPKIVLVSHPYNLYDDYVNLRTKEKLERLGAEVIFIDEIPIDETRNEIYPKFHWEFAKEIMEKVQAILDYDIAGAIEISSFQCGCDAVLKEFVEKEFKSSKIPFLYLIIDEQTGEAGLQTRLEAFIDTLKS